MGKGDSETAFYDYFSSVFLFSLDNGLTKRSIKTFNENYPTDDSEPPVVVDPYEYCYVAFRVAKGYTLTVGEFAFYAKAVGAGGVLSLDFFITTAVPSAILDKNSDEYNYYPTNPDDDTSYEGEFQEPEKDDEGNDIPRDDEVKEESLFSASLSYAKTQLRISPDEWNSTHLKFGEPQTVRAGEFIVIRVRNNCYISDEIFEEDAPEYEKLKFTFNYLMFYFSDIEKP